MQDLFILCNSASQVAYFKKKYPWSIPVVESTLTDSLMASFASQSKTSFYFVLNGDADVKDGFEFSYIPEEWDQVYTHIWNHSTNLIHYNRDLVRKNPNKYTYEAMCNGLIQFKNIDESIESGEQSTCEYTDVFVMAPLMSLADKTANALHIDSSRIKKIITAEKLTEEILHHIVLNASSDYVYVLDCTASVQNFDFSFIPQDWDAQYAHIWNWDERLILLSVKDISKNTDLYTNTAYINGSMPVKNTDQKIIVDVKKETNYNVFCVSHKQKQNDKVIYVKGSEITNDIVLECALQSNTSFFYVTTDKVNYESFDYSFTCDLWDVPYIQVWDKNTSFLLLSKDKIIENNGFKGLEFKNRDIGLFSNKTKWPVFKEGDEAVTDEDFYFSISNSVEVSPSLDYTFVPMPQDRNKIHVWQRINPHTNAVYDYSGVALIPNSDVTGKQYVRSGGSTSKPYDIIFLSYNEAFADEHYQLLLEKAPNAKRIHGVKGIYEAHIAAAQIAETSMFYIVDADAHLLPEYTFSFMPKQEDEHKVYVWRSKNPINDLIYGYGGVKLFPTKELLESSYSGIDFTTSITKDFNVVSVISNITKFNTDPFNTWKSAFRECVKLSSNLIDNDAATKARLEVWCNKGADREYGNFAISGAQFGKEFGELNKDNKEELSKINNYEWLYDQFKNKTHK